MNILYTVDWASIFAFASFALSVFLFLKYELKIKKLTSKVMSQEEALNVILPKVRTRVSVG